MPNAALSFGMDGIRSVPPLAELLEECPANGAIYKSVMVTYQKLFDSTYKKVLVSVSGGSDSDILIDLVLRCCSEPEKIEFVFFDTGLEYRATLEHLTFLEQKYGITIRREKALKPIPRSVKEYGQPFLSKRVSENMMRLQKYGFKWEDEDLRVLLDRYCRKASFEKREELEKRRALGLSTVPYAYHCGEWYVGCVSALMWWCNANDGGDKSQCNISHNRYLKEFIIANPPAFRIANMCCKFAKKDLAKQILKEGFDLSVIGVRKAEGGVRATQYKTCFNQNLSQDYDDYRPIFWYSDEDKKVYEKAFDVAHSRCYTQYGLRRTGCVGCPCARDFEGELEVCRIYEPQLYKAVTNVFEDAYAYRRAYDRFKKSQAGLREDGYVQLTFSWV